MPQLVLFEVMPCHREHLAAEIHPEASFEARCEQLEDPAGSGPEIQEVADPAVVAKIGVIDDEPVILFEPADGGDAR